MTIELAKLNQNIQRKLSSYLEAITEDFLEIYSTDRQATRTLEYAISGLKKAKSNIKEMYNLCLDAVPLDDILEQDSLEEIIKKYNLLLKKFDEITAKSEVERNNLLLNGKLVIKLDDDGATEMVVNGFDISAKGLGIEYVKWSDISEIKKSVKELNLANKNINQFLQKFNNYNLIIVTWEEFIKNLVNILRESALDSIMFDLDTEQANILALQTAQKMTRNSLLAANLTTQNVLKLI